MRPPIAVLEYSKTFSCKQAGVMQLIQEIKSSARWDLGKKCQSSGFSKLPLHPDYQLTTAHLFQQVAVLVTQEIRSLRIIGYVDSRAKKVDQLPSWVPDFSHTRNMHIEVPDPEKQNSFNASKYGSSSILDFAFEQDTLQLQGMRLATVSCLGQSLDQLTWGRHMSRTVRLLLSGPHTYFNGKSRIEAWWRT